MTAFSKKAPWILLVGDLAAFTISLWAALSARSAAVASKATFLDHLAPFSLLFVAWILVFFILGLYEKQAYLFRSRLPTLLSQAQVTNTLIAVAYFYLVPWFGIAPKTILFLYLIISLALVLIWRTFGFRIFVPRQSESAVAIGSGEEVEALVREVNAGRWGIRIAEVLSPDRAGEIEGAVERTHASVIAVDMMQNEAAATLPHLYDLMFRGVRFIDLNSLYEEVFDRVPLSLVRYDWFLSNVSAAPKAVYDALKRLMDVILSFIGGVLSLVLYPFVIVAIKAEDHGSIFFIQDRVGKNGKTVRIVKFRSMGVHREEDGLAKEARVTKVGSFLRKTRIDELPQLWNVLKGDLSLIGPRPEVPALAKVYEAQIPFYGIRHVIKPGLSGWAQIYHTTPPKWGAETQNTAEKLSYDLYYLKNRSFLLDLAIALKTVKEILSRKGI
ncbi:MAG TPA: exopolysaccharide biosynthesis polyprenyl glycosylphosphotransferase [Candidatus Paceibacterota bacterium]|jgi:exopolysaccharide biosynthesis polyprenyl glycosylphosphotransferase